MKKIFTKNSIYKLFFFLLLTGIYCGSFWILWSVTGNQAFDYDEAVYLTKARYLLEKTPANEYGIHRPIGMVLFGWLWLHFTTNEAMIRLFGNIFGALAIVFTYLLFKKMANIWVGLCMVLLIGTSPLFLKEASLFLNDIPSSGLLIGVLWILWSSYVKKGKSLLLYAAALLAGLAFYIRYGSVIPIAVIIFSTVILYLKQLQTKKNVPFQKAAIAVGIFILLLLPHFIQAYTYKGTILSILLISEKAANSAHIGDGLVQYIRLLPYGLNGWFVGISTILGILVTIAALFIKRIRQKYEGIAWLGSIGLLTFLITGLFIHAEARYVFLPLVLLSGIGVMGVYFVLTKLWKHLGKIVISVFIILIIYFASNNYWKTYNYYKEKEVDEARTAFLQGSDAIRNDTAGKPCAVWASENRPQFSWYTKCSTFDIKDFLTFRRDYLLHFKKSHYSVVFTGLKTEQITPSTAKAYNAQVSEIYRSNNISDTFGTIIVYRIDGSKIDRKQGEEEIVPYE